MYLLHSSLALLVTLMVASQLSIGIAFLPAAIVSTNAILLLLVGFAVLHIVTSSFVDSIVVAGGNDKKDATTANNGGHANLRSLISVVTHMALCGVISFLFAAEVFDLFHVYHTGRKAYLPSIAKFLCGSHLMRKLYYYWTWLVVTPPSMVALYILTAGILLAVARYGMLFSRCTSCWSRLFSKSKRATRRVSFAEDSRSEIYCKSVMPSKPVLLFGGLCLSAFITIGVMDEVNTSKAIRFNLLWRMYNSLPSTKATEDTTISGNTLESYHTEERVQLMPNDRRFRRRLSEQSSESSWKTTTRNLLGVNALASASSSVDGDVGGQHSYAPMKVRTSTTKSKKPEDITLVIVESLRYDAFAETFSAYASGENANVFFQPAYATMPNTLKSGLTWLCGRQPNAQLDFTEWITVTADNKGTDRNADDSASQNLQVNTCLPNILRKFANYKTRLISTGEHEGHLLSEDLMRAIGFDTVTGRESLNLKVDGGREGLRKAVLEAYFDETDHEKRKEGVASAAAAQDDPTFTLLFLAESHTKHHKGNKDLYIDALKWEAGIVEAIHKREKDAQKSTTTFLIGDHGELFGEHREWEHGGALYQEAVQVPIMIHKQQEDESNNVIFYKRQLLSLADVHATIVDMVGIGFTDSTGSATTPSNNGGFNTDGVIGLSLLKPISRKYLVLQSVLDESTKAYLFRDDKQDREKDDNQSDKGLTKLMLDWHHYDEPMLFDLSRDPKEQNPKSIDSLPLFRSNREHYLNYLELNDRPVSRMLLAESDVLVTKVIVSGCSSNSANGQYTPSCDAGGTCSERNGAPIYKKNGARLLEFLVYGGQKQWVLTYYYSQSGRGATVEFTHKVLSNAAYPPTTGWDGGCQLTLTYKEATVQTVAPKITTAAPTTAAPTVTNVATTAQPSSGESSTDGTTTNNPVTNPPAQPAKQVIKVQDTTAAQTFLPVEKVILQSLALSARTTLATRMDSVLKKAIADAKASNRRTLDEDESLQKMSERSLLHSSESEERVVAQKHGVSLRSPGSPRQLSAATLAKITSGSFDYQSSDETVTGTFSTTTPFSAATAANDIETYKAAILHVAFGAPASGSGSTKNLQVAEVSGAGNKLNFKLKATEELALDTSFNGQLLVKYVDSKTVSETQGDSGDLKNYYVAGSNSIIPITGSLVMLVVGYVMMFL